jgi:hypothetical protein
MEENKCFNKNIASWDEKYFPVIETWYMIFIILCIINEGLYFINIHDNDIFLIEIPFFHIPFTWAFWVIREFFINPHGDREYLLNYYPEIFKKIYHPLYGAYSVKCRSFKSVFVWKDFFYEYYIENGIDEVLDNIRNRWEKWYILFFRPWKIMIFFLIVTIINIMHKHGI